MKQSQRTRRISDLIAREMSSLLMTTRLEPNPGLVTITGCEVSLDLRVAHVFYSVFGTGGDSWKLAAEALEHAKSHFRHEIARRVNLRHTPEILFRPDHSLEEGAKIERLLRESKPPAGTPAGDGEGDDD